MPSSKPFLWFDDRGVCAACIAHEAKERHLGGIDWTKRKQQLDQLVDKAKAKNAPYYDVVVPVSGGKDSMYQVHTALGYGLRVLAAHVDYGVKTEVGKANLGCIPKMGATLITVRPELKYHIQLIRHGLEDYGDPDLMSHSLLYAYPTRIAAQFNVPLVMWGENSAFEYGGDEISGQKSHIDREWFLKYVVTGGVTVDEIATKYDIPLSVLKVYDFPEEEIRSQGIDAVFLSYFMPWDSARNLKIAMQYGFKGLGHPHEGTFRDFVGIDEKINRVHQYIKVLKFGYGRATDHACEEIRQGRMTRKQAFELVLKHDRQPLSDYFLNDVADFLGYTRDQFIQQIEKWRNESVWAQLNQTPIPANTPA
jgi:N-acetyl sugar amidotransferase